MSIRFDIDEKTRYEAGKWMTEMFGQPMENITWFWSHRLVRKLDGQNNEVWGCIEGIEIWKDCPNISLALIKWGCNVS
jgi:hypothetical protein